MRLNYDQLGQGLLLSGGGLMVHIDTFHDFSDVPLADTWGRRMARLPAPQLVSINPYQLLEVSDHQPSAR